MNAQNDLDVVKANKRLVFKEGGTAQAIEIKKRKQNKWRKL